VLAQEVGALPGVEPIEWMLLTTVQQFRKVGCAAAFIAGSPIFALSGWRSGCDLAIRCRRETTLPAQSRDPPFYIGQFPKNSVPKALTPA